MWKNLFKPSVKYSLIGLLATGFITGILFWGGFNTGMEATNKLVSLPASPWRMEAKIAGDESEIQQYRRECWKGPGVQEGRWLR